jgi:hypothetical protein
LSGFLSYSCVTTDLEASLLWPNALPGFRPFKDTDEVELLLHFVPSDTVDKEQLLELLAVWYCFTRYEKRWGDACFSQPELDLRSFMEDQDRENFKECTRDMLTRRDETGTELKEPNIYDKLWQEISLDVEAAGCGDGIDASEGEIIFPEGFKLEWREKSENGDEKVWRENVEGLKILKVRSEDAGHLTITTEAFHKMGPVSLREEEWVQEMEEMAWQGCREEKLKKGHGQTALLLAIAYWYMSPESAPRGGLHRERLLERLRLEQFFKWGIIRLAGWVGLFFFFVSSLAASASRHLV